MLVTERKETGALIYPDFEAIKTDNIEESGLQK
jgi:hypothetical protein